MKKFTVDVLLGKKSRLLYKKKKKNSNLIIIRANLKTGLATKNPPLGSLLGTYGIQAEAFCEIFNKTSTQLWPQGTLIPIIIVISPTKTYIIEYTLPTVLYLYDLVFKLNARKPTHFHGVLDKWFLLYTSYKMNLIKVNKVRSSPRMLAGLKQMLGTFQSFQMFSYLRTFKHKFNFKKKKGL